MTLFCPTCANPLNLMGLAVDGGPGLYEAKLICVSGCADDAAGFQVDMVTTILTDDDVAALDPSEQVVS